MIKDQIFFVNFQYRANWETIDAFAQVLIWVADGVHGTIGVNFAFRSDEIPKTVTPPFAQLARIVDETISWIE